VDTIRKKPKLNHNLKGECPNCGEIIEFPYEDRVDVILFGNWRKYHKDKDCNPSKRRIENESKS
jgi:hypothetical protein